MSTQRAKGRAARAGWYLACALLLAAAGATGWALTRATPIAVVPRAVEGAPVLIRSELAGAPAHQESEPDALWDPSRAEAVYLRRWTK